MNMTMEWPILRLQVKKKVSQMPTAFAFIHTDFCAVSRIRQFLLDVQQQVAYFLWQRIQNDGSFFRKRMRKEQPP
ncbi:MAG: hypothetical protein Q9P14_02560 [candidate division KSB1 bacterium]|nr:hypothetical protein [candidate division KSB1 bacterium]MDQ7063184.1 hypothetical protein [candidate division KSB1 bacterium]